MKNIFTEHPKTIGETYVEHLLYASGVGWRCLKIAGIAFCHAVLPFTFEHTAGDMIQELAVALMTRQNK